MKTLQSRNNPLYKELIKLAGSAKCRAKVGQTLLDGAHLLTAYLDAGLVPQQLLLNGTALHNREITRLLARVPAVPLTLLEDSLYAVLSELKTPSGLLALIDIPQPAKSACCFALLLEDIQDPGNLGNMLRTAAAAGCDAVFLSTGCADAWSPKVLRAAMGGHFALNIYQQQHLPEVAQAFDGSLLASSLQATHSLYGCDLRGKVAFLIGNEGAGLSAPLLKLATHVIGIPMPGRQESLNAAAAAAICLYEAVRQRCDSDHSLKFLDA